MNTSCKLAPVTSMPRITAPSDEISASRLNPFRRLRHSHCRRLRGRNVYWTTGGVSHALDRSFAWLCCPSRGKVLTWEEWEG